MDRNRATVLKAFEAEAELVGAHQLDLVAQLEAQLRAVHRTMRSLVKLRGARYRPTTAELTNGQRADTLQILEAEIRAIDEELQTQHQSCLDMLQVIRQMQVRLTTLRTLMPAHRDQDESDGSEGSPHA